MRLMVQVGVGMMVATVGYALMGWAMYDVDHPSYEVEEGSVTRLIDEREWEGVRYWTETQTWRFTGYEPGPIGDLMSGSEVGWMVYFRMEPAFRPLAGIIRRCKGHPSRAESGVDRADDPTVWFCSRARRWKALEP